MSRLQTLVSVYANLHRLAITLRNTCSHSLATVSKASLPNYFRFPPPPLQTVPSPSCHHKNTSYPGQSIFPSLSHPRNGRPLLLPRVSNINDVIARCLMKKSKNGLTVGAKMVKTGRRRHSGLQRCLEMLVCCLVKSNRHFILTLPLRCRLQPSTGGSQGA